MLKLDLQSAAFGVDPTILVQHNDQGQEGRIPLVVEIEKGAIFMTSLRLLISRNRCGKLTRTSIRHAASP
jgi:hypothetical protein